MFIIALRFSNSTAPIRSNTHARIRKAVLISLPWSRYLSTTSTMELVAVGSSTCLQRPDMPGFVQSLVARPVLMAIPWPCALNPCISESAYVPRDISVSVTPRCGLVGMHGIVPWFETSPNRQLTPLRETALHSIQSYCVWIGIPIRN